jgi:hypothetical protein
LKTIITIITGAVVGALTVYFTLDWQEEKITFSITPPAKFGDINYQNITLVNDGWNPAENLKIYIEHAEITFANIQSSSSLSDLSPEINGIASLDRIRRDESLVISLAYKGQRLLGNEIKIASDRSIALQTQSDNSASTNWWKIAFLSSVGVWFIGIFSAIAIPAYQNYKKLAEESVRKNGDSR